MQHLNKYYIKIAILLAYAFFISLITYFHEPWRDELQAVSLMRNSHSFQEFLQNIKYEGHPVLWFLIIKAILFFNGDIGAIQIFHLSFIFVFAFLIVFISPFRLYQKMAIIFGYFFVYEYAAIFRNYSLGISLLFLAIILYEKKSLLWAGVLISLAMQTNIYACFIGLSLWCTIFLFNFRIGQLGKLVIGSLIILVSLVITLYIIIPPRDSANAMGDFLQRFNFFTGGVNIWKAYIPLPIVKIQFWGTNFVELISHTYGSAFVMLLGAYSLLLFFIIHFRVDKFVLFFFCSATFILLIFTSIKFNGYIRHHGHFFIILLISMWLLKKSQYQVSDVNFSFFNKVFSLMLVCHIVAASIAFFYEYHYSFSKGKEVVQFLKKNEYDNKIIVGYPDYSVSTISTLLDKSIFYPNINQFGKFIIWNTAHEQQRSDSSIIQIFNNFGKERAVLITSKKIPDDLLLQNNILYKNYFGPSIASGEEFYFYVVK